MKALLAVVVAAIAVFAIPAFADDQPNQVATPAATAVVPTLPASLSGRWYTPDNRYSQTWTLEKINQASGTVVVTMFTPGKKICEIRNAAAKLEVTPDRIRVTNPDTTCGTNFSAELTKGSSGEWAGKISGFLVGTPYSYVDATLK